MEPRDPLSGALAWITCGHLASVVGQCTDQAVVFCFPVALTHAFAQAQAPDALAQASAAAAAAASAAGRSKGAGRAGSGRLQIASSLRKLRDSPRLAAKRASEAAGDLQASFSALAAAGGRVGFALGLHPAVDGSLRRIFLGACRRAGPRGALPWLLRIGGEASAQLALETALSSEKRLANRWRSIHTLQTHINKPFFWRVGAS